jgi:subtilisin family serine protease
MVNVRRVLGLQGTSVAAPVVAGMAALVRQYFREGYYPTGPNLKALDTLINLDYYRKTLEASLSALVVGRVALIP